MGCGTIYLMALKVTSSMTRNIYHQKQVDWLHSMGDQDSTFDFTTKGILQEVVKEKELWHLWDLNGIDQHD
jgi:hypothetical protein